MHPGMMIMNMTSEIGHMLVDEKYCKEFRLSEEELMNFIDMVITEYESSYQLKHANLNKMKSDINEYMDHCVSEKNKLVAEEKAEAAADIIAAAADVAAACTEWIPGVNLAFTAAAIAAQATAMGLEIATKKLEKTVVEDISKADLKIREKPSFKNIKVYLDAQTSNTKFFIRLNFGMTHLQMRAAFISTVISTTKFLGRKITKEDLKTMFIYWYNATEDDKTLVKRFSELYDEMEASPEDTKPFEKKFDTLINSMNPTYKEIGTSFVLLLTTSLVIKKGKAFYKIYKSVNSLARAFAGEFKDLDADGNVIEAGSEVEEGELRVLGKAEAISLGISFLAAAVNVFFSVLEIVKVHDTDKKLTKAISDARNAIIKYYEKLVDNSH